MNSYFVLVAFVIALVLVILIWSESPVAAVIFKNNYKVAKPVSVMLLYLSLFLVSTTLVNNITGSPPPPLGYFVLVLCSIAVAGIVCTCSSPVTTVAEVKVNNSLTMQQASDLKKLITDMKEKQVKVFSGNAQATSYDAWILATDKVDQYIDSITTK